MNLSEQIPGTGRALGSFSNWEELTVAQFEKAAEHLVGPGYGRKLFKDIMGVDHPGKTGDEGAIVTPFTPTLQADKLHLTAKVEKGKDPLTKKPIQEWKNWWYTKEQLLAL